MCNCITELELKLKEKFEKDVSNCEDFHQPQIQYKSLMIPNEENKECYTVMSGYSEVSYKTNTNKKKKWKIYVNFCYCPFCGIKYDNN